MDVAVDQVEFLSGIFQRQAAAESAPTAIGEPGVAEENDPPPSLIEQVCDGEPGSFNFIAAHGVDRQAADAGVEKEEFHSRKVSAASVVLLTADFVRDDDIAEAAAFQGDADSAADRHIVRIRDDERFAAAVFFNEFGDPGIVGELKRRQQQGDRAGSFRPVQDECSQPLAFPEPSFFNQCAYSAPDRADADRVAPGQFPFRQQHFSGGKMPRIDRRPEIGGNLRVTQFTEMFLFQW